MDVHIGAKGCQCGQLRANCGEVALLQLWADLGERARYQLCTMSAVHKLSFILKFMLSMVDMA